MFEDHESPPPPTPLQSWGLNYDQSKPLTLTMLPCQFLSYGPRIALLWSTIPMGSVRVKDRKGRRTFENSWMEDAMSGTLSASL